MLNGGGVEMLVNRDKLWSDHEYNLIQRLKSRPARGGSAQFTFEPLIG